MQSLKILLAEDDRVSATLVVGALRRFGFEVDVVSDGLEAEERLIRDRSIRLVISDWMMPGLDGLQLCRRLRSRVEPAYTYFILITARSGTSARLEGYQAGVDDFLTKPLNLDELLARVRIAQRILAMQGELIRRSEELEALRRDLELRNEYLADMALTDALTGLRNRRHFHRACRAGLQLSAQTGQPLTVILLDIDHFKRYNDTYGHPAGDEVLIGVADVLRANVRDRDLIVRYGGEEFVVLLPRVSAAEGIALAERLRRSLASRHWPEAPITASFGVGTSGHSTPTLETLLDHADQALYRSKQRGRNCVTHFRELSRGQDLGPIVPNPRIRADVPLNFPATGTS